MFPMLHVAVFFHGNWYSFFHSYSLAMFFGLFSYGYFSLALVLAARIRAFDRIFGHNRVIVFHGIVASLALLPGVFHAILKFVFFPDPTLQSALGVGGLLLFLIVIKLTFIFMVRTPLHRRVFPGKMLAFITKKFHIDYSIMKVIHNLCAPALLLLGIHVMLALPVQETLARTVVSGLSGGIAIAFYLFHAFMRPLLRKSRAFRIRALRRLSDTIVEIEMKSAKNERFAYTAGQFAYFRFLSDVCGRAEHPFSISSAPSTDTLCITVKALGDYTKKLASLKPETPVIVDGPYGVFTADRSQHPLLLLAGGIGITPFLSMIRESIALKEQRPVTLVWSVLVANETFALSELREAEKKLPHFRLVLRVTGDVNPESGAADGFVDTALLRPLCTADMLKYGNAFLCGPEPFMAALHPMLREIGFTKSRIHSERFSF